MRELLDQVKPKNLNINPELKTEIDFTITCDFFMMLCSYLSKYDMHNTDDHFQDAYREVDALANSPEGRLQMSENTLRVAEKMLSLSLSSSKGTSEPSDDDTKDVNYIY